MGGLLHLVRRGGDWAGPRSPPRPLLAVPNVTAHPSTATVPITVLLYNGPLLCGFNMFIKGLKLVDYVYCATVLDGSSALQTVLSVWNRQLYR